MGKIDLAIKALSELPLERQEEIADLVLELAAAVSVANSALTDDQRAEVLHRRASGFQRGDASRIDALIARLS